MLILIEKHRIFATSIMTNNKLSLNFMVSKFLFSSNSDEWSTPKCKCVVLLVPARIDSSWFHDYVLNKAEIRFIRGRLKFGISKNSAPFPSMIVIWK